MANLVNLERVSKAYGVQRLLDGVSLGVGESERIGVVGRNGTGKTTLLNVIAGSEPPDEGRVARNRGLRVGMLTQHDDLDPDLEVLRSVVGDRPEHEWRSDRRIRDILSGLLADVASGQQVGTLSGGERRRTAMARLLVNEHDLLLLDEPTNHLDIEVTDWLARHLTSRREALVVVTHDRWFLDEVATTTWEITDGQVVSYEGGYAAYTLAKAERARLADATESKRQNLLRKELAWLHRQPKARTGKSKYRVDAAAELVANEPAPRDSLELAKLVSSRLGKTVVDVHDVDVVRGDRTLLEHLDWQLGPGDRIGVVGVNGAGKTSLLRVLAGEDEPTRGKVIHGRTVSLGHLSQGLGVLDPSEQVLDAVEGIRKSVRLAPDVRPGAVGRRPVPTSGGELSATSLLERFGFRGDRLRTRVGDLSGGERRRLEFLALLLHEPNVLLLDEPTNDLDIETLQVIEDLLDNWPGSLLVVTHDRYFLERVSDSIWALLGDGRFGMLPGGVEEYLRRRGAQSAHGIDGGAASSAGTASVRSPVSRSAAGAKGSGDRPNATEQRELKKELARVERRIGRLGQRETELHGLLAQHAEDYERLMELDAELRTVVAEKDELETRWLELGEELV